MIDISSAPWESPARPRRVRTRTALVVTAVLLALAAAGGGWAYHLASDDRRHNYLGSNAWPDQGQAAIQVTGREPHASPGQRPAPIASMAKVMTAYLVLRARPLAADEHGFRLPITEADERRTERERDQDQSVVTLEAGEILTERAALLAVLLPSANNVAEALARHVAGSVPAFVRRMNAAAAALGMTHTHYADPSGFDPRTVSTAGDQLRLARVMAGNETFSQLVATPSYDLPGAGTIRNTDVLLGHDGFVGTKTGSDDAAGGCFMFRVRRVVGGRWTEVLGVVMGQRGHDLVRTGQYAAAQLVDRVVGTI